jgi:mycofactocin system glycosyltransferase
VTPLPEGFGLVLDRSVRSFRDGTVLVGGHPGRLISLSPEGVHGLAALLADDSPSIAARQLGARLVDAGMAHPRRAAPCPAGFPSVTVVVPAHDRSDALDRCLRSVGSRLPVVVVDDASEDPGAIAEVCRRHGARVIRRAANGGAGAARNEALEAVDTELVAFVDSDCTVTEQWIERLVWLFDDPGMAAVAPRVRPERGAGALARRALARYSDARSALDMGPDEGEVGPDRLVRYVPTAALVVRRSALASGFDPTLRVGEDVDLVWRMVEAGWHVRYDPSVIVSHREPSSWRTLAARRFRYGTSAAALSQRHPGYLAPVELRPWPAAATVAGLCGRPRVAGALVVAAAAVLFGKVGRRGIPAWLTLRWSAQAAGWTAVGVGRAATTLAGPAVAVSMVRGRARRRAVAAALVLAPPLVEWWRRRPGIDPVRWAAASIADDVAYGAGVWSGCLRMRSFGPLVPALRLGHQDAPRPSGDTGGDNFGVTMEDGEAAHPSARPPASGARGGL